LRTADIPPHAAAFFAIRLRAAAVTALAHTFPPFNPPSRPSAIVAGFLPLIVSSAELQHGAPLHLRETLTGSKAQLDWEPFPRSSRSALVNLDRIKELQPMFKGEHVVVLQ
jgi:hypothetical protein